MFNKLIVTGMAFGLLVSMSSCNKEDDPTTTDPTTSAGYVVAIRAQGSANESTDYLLQTTSLTSGTLTIAGQGIEQQGYRSYAQAGKTVFSIGTSDASLGVPTAIGYVLDATNKLTQKGSVTFDKTFEVITTVDENTLAGVQIPRTAAQNREAIFYTADANTVALKGQVKSSLAPLYKDDQVWPSGMRVRDGKAYVSYYLQDRTTYATPNTDTAYVAIYAYPAFTLEKVIKDTRTGPAGAFNSSNGLIKAENGDIYTVASSGYTFSQRTKPAGFLRIKNGETAFDASYFFDLDAISNGRKLYFSQYLGNGLVLAEMGRFPVANGQWAYDNVDLNVVIIDLNAKTIKEVAGGIPTHAGQGGTTLSFPIENGKVYLPVTSYTEGTYIWEIDIASATAKRGAKVEAKYVSGIFKL